MERNKNSRIILVWVFFQIDSYKLLKPFMQANNLTKAPRSEIERQGMTDAHHQQALGQG